MNVHLHHAISDLTWVTGMAITDAILEGERDPARLAALADRRIKASRDTLIRRCRATGARSTCWRCCTREPPMPTTNSWSRSGSGNRSRLRAFETTSKPPGEVADDRQDEGTGAEPEPPTEITGQAVRPAQAPYAAFGTDLTLIPGIGESTALVLFAELGPDLSLIRPRRNSLLAEPVPSQPDHWWQDHQLTHRSRHQSGRPGAALGHPVVVPQPNVRRVSTSAACERARVLRRRPLRPPANWRGSFTI